MRLSEAVLPHAVPPTVAETANDFAKVSLVRLLVLALPYPGKAT